MTFVTEPAGWRLTQRNSPHPHPIVTARFRVYCFGDGKCPCFPKCLFAREGRILRVTLVLRLYKLLLFELFRPYWKSGMFSCRRGLHSCAGGHILWRKALNTFRRCLWMNEWCMHKLYAIRLTKYWFLIKINFVPNDRLRFLEGYQFPLFCCSPMLGAET